MHTLNTETAIIPYQSPETTILYSIWKTDHSYLPNFWVWDRIGDRCKALAAEKTSFLSEAYFDAFMILNWSNQVDGIAFRPFTISVKDELKSLLSPKDLYDLFSLKELKELSQIPWRNHDIRWDF